jgi:hypothetical protein
MATAPAVVVVGGEVDARAVAIRLLPVPARALPVLADQIVPAADVIAEPAMVGVGLQIDAEPVAHRET